MRATPPIGEASLRYPRNFLESLAATAVTGLTNPALNATTVQTKGSQ